MSATKTVSKAKEAKPKVSIETTIVASIESAYKQAMSARAETLAAKEQRQALRDLAAKHKATFDKILKTMSDEIVKWVTRVLKPVEKKSDVAKHAKISKEAWESIGKANGWIK